jgi:RNA polymerase sigma-54 factor
MKASLALRTSQSLALTPQLRLAIRVLRMSTQELAEMINEAAMSNPLLEVDEAVAPADSDDDGDEGSNLGSEAGDLADGESATDETGMEATADRIVETLPEDFEATDRWDEPPSRGSFDENDAREPAAGIGLKEHVWSQVACLGLREGDLAIAAALVDALDDDGYLRAESGLIREALGLPDLAEERIEGVRRRLLTLDPTGIGARTLGECLLAQLAELPEATPGLALARRLVADHIDLLGERPERIAAALRLDAAECARARSLVASLDPRPGARFADTAADHVVPDVEAYRERGRWRVRLVAGAAPRLRLARTYAGLARARGSAEETWVHARLQEARWLIRSIEQREETLLRVAAAIVDHQGAFLDFGPQAMRPLSMRDVADRLGLHESTVSRAVAHKYLATPRGTFELRRFFPTGIATSSGGSASSTAIKAYIREIIAAESPAEALSDQAVAERLSAQGLPVARRTVAKYREALGIPPSHERQRSARR